MKSDVEWKRYEELGNTALRLVKIMMRNPGDQLANREFCSVWMMHVGVMQGNEILCSDWSKL